jgi:hypothetical protein
MTGRRSGAIRWAHALGKFLPICPPSSSAPGASLLRQARPPRNPLFPYPPAPRSRPRTAGARRARHRIAPTPCDRPRAPGARLHKLTQCRPLPPLSASAPSVSPLRQVPEGQCPRTMTQSQATRPCFLPSCRCGPWVSEEMSVRQEVSALGAWACHRRALSNAEGPVQGPAWGAEWERPAGAGRAVGFENRG